MNKKFIAIISSIAILMIGIIIALLLMNNKKYEVTFDSNGGSIVETQIVKKSNIVKKPTNPTKNGYVFENWYLDNEVFDFSTPITKNIKLVAKWEKISIDSVEVEKYTIRFDSNGGSEISSVEVEENELLDKPTDPTRKGYKFISWQLNGKDFDFDTKITKNLTLIAKWEKVSSKPSTSGNSTSGSANGGSSGNTNSGTSGNTGGNTSGNTDNKPTTIDVTSITLSKTTLNLNAGDSSTLLATVEPNNATNKTITWSSNDTAVATVDNNGKVTAVGAGTATITVKAGNKTATCVITVIKPVTYSVQWEKVENSSIGQYMLYIRSSEGKNVAGVVTITTTAGNSSDVEITSAGKMYIKSAVQNAVIKSVN